LTENLPILTGKTLSLISLFNSRQDIRPCKHVLSKLLHCYGRVLDGTLYEVIQFMNDILGKESRLFVPYELLKKNKKEFLRQTIVRLGLIPDKKIDRYLVSEKENINHNKENMRNLVRDISNLQKILIILTQYKRFIPSSMLGFVKKIYIAIS
jgi:hypothetical protein